MEWKTIKYNDKYEVSDTGLVRTKKTGHIHSGCIAQGYLSVKLTFENSRQKRFKIHRLVAEHFIENPDPKKKTFVNHIDGNKLNNSIENLEWCDKKYNNEHAIGIGLNHIGKKKKCCMIDCSTNQIIEVFDSIAELALNYSVDGSTVSKQCRGIKNRFNNGLKARLFDEKNNSFVSTKFD